MNIDELFICPECGNKTREFYIEKMGEDYFKIYCKWCGMLVSR